MCCHQSYVQKKPLISVIMPVYNVASYLETAVYAVLNQSYRHLEVLLIDDGATDGTSECCDALARQDGRIRVVHQANQGQAAARNVGLDLATGEYIGFVDGDDWIEPDFYAQLMTQLLRAGAEMAACSFVKVSARSNLEFATDWQPFQILSPEGALALMFEKTGMRYSPCNKLYKRILFDELRYPVGCHYEDKALTYQLIHRSQTVVYSPSAKYHYFVRPDSVMRSPLSSSNFDIYQINERLIRFLESHYPNLVNTAWRSYADECRNLAQRMTEEAFESPEAMARCQLVIDKAQHLE